MEATSYNARDLALDKQFARTSAGLTDVISSSDGVGASGAVLAARTVLRRKRSCGGPIRGESKRNEASRTGRTALAASLAGQRLILTACDALAVRSVRAEKLTNADLAHGLRGVRIELA